MSLVEEFEALRELVISELEEVGLLHPMVLESLSTDSLVILLDGVASLEEIAYQKGKADAYAPITPAWLDAKLQGDQDAEDAVDELRAGLRCENPDCSCNSVTEYPTF